ncbi:MAG: hypothetical protein ACLTXI_06650 [Collinsella sp.]
MAPIAPLKMLVAPAAKTIARLSDSLTTKISPASSNHARTAALPGPRPLLCTQARI